MRKILLLTIIGLIVSFADASAATTGIYSSTYGDMSLTQDGASVWGTYTNDGGEIIGTLSRNELRGWWREAGNTKSCGPNNAWSGEILFVFAPDGTAFPHGDWSNCNSGRQLSPTQTSWTGALLSGTPINTGFISFPADCVARFTIDSSQQLHLDVPCLELGDYKLWLDMIYLNKGLDFSIVNYGAY